MLRVEGKYDEVFFTQDAAKAHFQAKWSAFVAEIREKS